MKGRNHNIISIKGLVVIGDFIVLNLCFLLTFLVIYSINPFETIFQEENRMSFILINMSYAISISHFGIILDKRTVFIETILNKVIKTVAWALVILFAALTFMRDFIFLTSFWVLFAFSLFLLIAGWRICARLSLKRYRKRGGNYRSVIILGAGNVANEVYNSIIKNLSYGYKFQGFFDDRDPSEYVVEGDLVKGKINDVIKFTEHNRIDEIICALPAGEDRKFIPILKYAENNLIRCFIIPDFKRFLTRKVNLSF